MQCIMQSIHHHMANIVTLVQKANTKTPKGLQWNVAQVKLLKKEPIEHWDPALMALKYVSPEMCADISSPRLRAGISQVIAEKNAYARECSNAFYSKIISEEFWDSHLSKLSVSQMDELQKQLIALSLSMSQLQHEVKREAKSVSF